MLLTRSILLASALSLMSAGNLWASSDGSKTGRSGRPGDATGCAGCHSDPGIEDTPPTVMLSHPGTINVGESMVFTINVATNETKSGFGYDIAVEDTSVGSFSNTDADAKVNSSDPSEVTHPTIQAYETSDGNKEIMLDFTPAFAGTHTLYIVINDVNSNGNPSGDTWYATTETFTVTDATDAGNSDGSSTETDAGDSDGSSTETDAGDSDGSSTETDAGDSDGSSVETDAGESDGSSVETDAGSSDGSTETDAPDAGTTDDGDTDGDSDGGEETEEGGCGCNTQGNGGAAGYLLGGLFLFGLALRRRRK